MDHVDLNAPLEDAVIYILAAKVCVCMCVYFIDRSFIGVPCREKRVSSSQAGAGAAACQMRTLPTTKTVPSDLDLSGENMGHSEG